MIPGMSRCSRLHLRQAKNGQNWLHIPHFYAVKREFAKEQIEVSEANGWGAGFLTGGIVALVLSFLGKTKKAVEQVSQGSEPTSDSPHRPA